MGVHEAWQQSFKRTHPKNAETTQLEHSMPVLEDFPVLRLLLEAKLAAISGLGAIGSTFEQLEIARGLSETSWSALGQLWEGFWSDQRGLGSTEDPSHMAPKSAQELPRRRPEPPRRPQEHPKRVQGDPRSRAQRAAEVCDCLSGGRLRSKVWQKTRPPDCLPDKACLPPRPAPQRQCPPQQI